MGKIKATKCLTCENYMTCEDVMEYTSFVDVVKAGMNTTGNLDLNISIKCNRG